MTSPVSAIEAIEKAMEGVTHTDAPEWIAVAQDGDGPNGGFWTCAAATTESPRYIRADIYSALARQAEALQRKMAALLDAEALSGIRALVAGWNGEHLPENERFGRHHDELGVKLPTTCGAIYALDDAMIRARALLGGENAGN